MLKGIIKNARDARTLGFSFLGRHFKSKSAVRHRFTLKGIGPLAIRPGSSDAQVIRQIFQGREYDLHRAGKAFNRLIRRYREIVEGGEKPVIVDAGANIGASALWFHRMFPDAIILSIEPDSANFALLTENCAPVPNIRPIQAALGGQGGRVSIAGEAAAWALQTKRDDKGSIDVVTVGQLLDGGEVSGTVPFLVKIDIEGFEADVFDGETDWIDRITALIVEPHDWMLPDQRSSRSFQREMGKRDFQIFVSGENLVYIS